MSIRQTPGGTVVDRVEPQKDEGPPPPADDGDMATPKSSPPTEDDQPLE